MQYLPRRAPDNQHLSDFTLLRHAIDTAASADPYAVSSTSHDPFVVQFLLGRSLELTLKAFGIHAGATEAQLRALGHDIAMILAYPEEKGLSSSGLSAMEKNQILHLSAIYKRKGSEYPLVGAYQLVGSRQVRQIVDTLLAVVCPRQWGAARYGFERANAGKGLYIDPSARCLTPTLASRGFNEPRVVGRKG